MKLLLVSPGAHWDRHSVVSEGVRWPSLVLKYSLLVSSFSRISNSIGLVGDRPTLWLRLRYHGLLQTRILYCCSYCPITLTSTLSCLFALSL